MNNILGFTAEASLYRASGHYQLAAGRVNGAAEQALIPQFRCLRTANGITCRCRGVNDCLAMGELENCSGTFFCDPGPVCYCRV
jgi:hypothetical protein